ncbi:MAG: AmmeMemoRadiSam system radical SAM enzyme [Candidatus Ancaeobacter aquaticus]|nr:AmmeMemoRadiSam system radical SAM enzyme [Candidatus Ancaeobacter aquaticus]
MREALFYEKTDNKIVRCRLCPHNCVINEGKSGLCKVRRNVSGVLYSAIYAEITSCGLDPIEKKPLYHFYPGHQILSIGTKGCNFACTFCQNWTLSQNPDAPSEEVLPDKIVETAQKEGSFGIAYTYTEPFVWYEYVKETSKIARSKGLKNVLVTNGYVKEEPLLELLPYIDAVNIDIKSMDDSFYKDMCGASRDPVLRTAEMCYANSCHVEITNLVISTLNDSPGHFEKLRDWICDHLSPSVPLHFSRYFPTYKLSLPPTPVSVLEEAYKIAKEKMMYVYLGNVGGGSWDSTYCPDCSSLLVSRSGYAAEKIGIKENACSKCGRTADIIGL